MKQVFLAIDELDFAPTYFYFDDEGYTTARAWCFESDEEFIKYVSRRGSEWKHPTAVIEVRRGNMRDAKLLKEW